MCVTRLTLVGSPQDFIHDAYEIKDVLKITFHIICHYISNKTCGVTRRFEQMVTPSGIDDEEEETNLYYLKHILITHT